MSAGGAGGDERAEPRRETELRFGRDVRRILSDRCFPCHGADSAAREAGLRLDQRASALADLGGYAALVPGRPNESELWLRVTSVEADERMPPASAKKRPLSADELRTLERWIEQGAEYEPHWSFVAPVRPEPPDVADATWPRGAIDRFVLAGLEAEGVAPSPEADRATLLRRVFLDLTGLPPTIRELDEFLVDERADAYERVVDRLFTAEPYVTRLAERLATPWLDSARYADTNGIHTDNGRQLWPWRDWVLAALRDNMPYDRFLVEQLAGDLLPDATRAQRIASGFNRNHVTTDEGGAIPEEYLVEYAVDRASTTSAVFLGLTAGCARCHDHKFDPLTQRDFYGLFAFFNSIDEPGLYTQTQDAQRAYEPFLEVPAPEQTARLDALALRLDELALEMEHALPGEAERRTESFAELAAAAGVSWTTPEVRAAESSSAGVALELQEDGSILATGAMPDFEDYTLELRTTETSLRVLLLEALSSGGGAGRASHGNAVVSSITVEARPADLGGAVDWTPVPLSWAWADHTQTDRDFEAVNVIGTEDTLGWAADGNERAGARTLLLQSAEPFGFEAGTDLRVTLAFRSDYAQHSLARVRLRVSPLADPGLLPVASGRWYRTAPFRPTSSDERGALYGTRFGPEDLPRIDPLRGFGPDELRWSFAGDFADEVVNVLPAGVGASYVGRTLWSPDARALEVSLGSDDGYALFVNGEPVAENRVDRGAAPDQERVTVNLRPGANAFVLKVVNTGGESGFYYRTLPPERVLVDELPSVLQPADAVPAEQQDDLARAWRRRFFAGWRALDDERQTLEGERDRIRTEVPRTMVMQELAEPRATYLLMRGQYDQPDLQQPVPRAVPGFLPQLPDDAPRNRLGLARWMVADENPLVARVAVNRFWQMLFGTGLVRTSEDFGVQGEWPSHPELLDWLAVEFRESGWDVHALLRRIVTSSTYRQDSTVRPELTARDPAGRWLASYPRRRLSAEQVRDLALFVSGLLVERFGGPSVKTYQPAGLWREVAMPASNTREFEPGRGDDLWRRSLYTYWKRAVPPPALQTFDAPTRESCVVRRQQTNTPLQALVLWNDEPFVEAARRLAERALGSEGMPEDDTAFPSPSAPERIRYLFRACTGRLPEKQELQRVLEALDAYRERFASHGADAEALLGVGQSSAGATVPPAELAAWTMVASAILNLHETLTQD